MSLWRDSNLQPQASKASRLPIDNTQSYPSFEIRLIWPTVSRMPFGYTAKGVGLNGWQGRLRTYSDLSIAGLTVRWVYQFPYMPIIHSTLLNCTTWESDLTALPAVSDSRVVSVTLVRVKTLWLRYPPWSLLTQHLLRFHSSVSICKYSIKDICASQQLFSNSWTEAAYLLLE